MEKQPRITDREVSLPEKFFPGLLLIFILIFGIIGTILFIKGDQPDLAAVRSDREIGTKFIIEQPKPVKSEMISPPAPQKKVEKKKNPEPIDLTKKEVEKPEPEIEPEPSAAPPEEEPRKVRKVYGLKNVYSQGLGSGVSSEDAVVGKLGNTLNKEFDTLTADTEDLKAKKVISIATVDKQPRLRDDFKHMKPVYTEEMLANRVEGVVKAKILIDVDGKVKNVLVLNDLGFGSEKVASDYMLKLEFEPATKNGEPVAVWKIFSIRFEIISG